MTALLPSLLRLLPGVVVAALLLALYAAAPPALVGGLVAEDGPVEWVQVGLAAVALLFVVLAAARHFLPGDVLLGALFASLATSEIDLDRRIFGLPVIDWKFLRRPAVPLPLRVLAATVIVAAVAALLVYAAIRWRALALEIREAFDDRWAGLFIAGVVLFAIPQPCERCLNTLIPALPHYFLEETLELMGCLYFAFAMAVRARCRR